MYKKDKAAKIPEKNTGRESGSASLGMKNPMTTDPTSSFEASPKYFESVSIC